MAFKSEHPNKWCQKLLSYLFWQPLACKSHLMRENCQKCGHLYKDQRWTCKYSISSLEKDYDGFDHCWQTVWICVRYTDLDVESDTKTRSGTGAQGGHYFSLDGVVSYGSNASKRAGCWTDASELEVAEWCDITGKEGWAVPKEIRQQDEGGNSNDKQRSQRGQVLNFDHDRRWGKKCKQQ